MTRVVAHDWAHPRPRAKLRFPPMPPRVVLAGVVLAAVFGAIRYLASPDRFPVRQVMLRGDFARVDRKALMAAVAPALSGNFFRLDLAAVAARADTVPWVYRAVVARAWPFRVEITFTVQHPIARWSGGGWLNQEGSRIHLGALKGPPGLPVLSGPSASEARVYARFREVSQLLNHYGTRLTVLSLSARGGWRLTTEGGTTIVMGRTQAMSRLDRFLELRARIMAGHKRIARRVDLRYGNGFAIAWAQSPAPGGRP
ncbi:MAG: cell division protein FtsQ/DivIB [Acidiferrobacteraceae bacterium]